MYIRLAGAAGNSVRNCIWHSRRGKKARRNRESSSWSWRSRSWMMEDGSWWRATRKTQFHFSFRKRQAKYKCKGKAKKRTKTWAQQRGIRDLSIAVQLMSCVCEQRRERRRRSENRQRCELKCFFLVQMKTNLCATCSQRPFGVSSAQPDFPALLLTWHKRREGRPRGVWVLRWWFELTSWPAANLDLMKYERRPAADTNCNSFIKDTLCCCSSQVKAERRGRGGTN